MSDLPQQQQGNFTPGAAREALKYLRQRGKGSLLVTSGLQDVRLVVSGRSLSLEAEGHELFGEEKRDLVRQFLCAIFWEDPTYFIDPNGAGGTASSSINIDASQFEVLNLIDRGIIDLKPLHERVPGIDLMVSVTGDGPPDDIKSSTANLFRVLQRMPNGGHLATAAESADIDELDAAWSVSDLIDASQAAVRRPPPTMTVRRLLHAEGYAEAGLMPAIRYVHLARGLTRGDPKRAARLYQDAANAFLLAGLAEQAMTSFRSCLELAPENIAALEGLAGALEQLKRAAEGKRIREKLINLFLSWRMPSRARKQLEGIAQLTGEQQERLLGCMLQMGDFQAATALSKRLIHAIDGAGKVALAERFAKAGARGKELQAIVSLCGLQKLAPLRSASKALVFLALLVCILLGGEVFLRTRFHAAAKASFSDAGQAEFEKALERWQMLADLDTTLGASSAKLPLTCLSQVGDVVSDLHDLQDDRAALEDDAEARKLLQSWDAPPELKDRDIPGELPRLKFLLEGAKSEHLKARIGSALALMQARREQAEAKVKAYEGLAKRLDEAKELIRDYANVRQFDNKPDLLIVDGKSLTLSVRVSVSPKGGILFREEDGKEKRYRAPKPGANTLVDTWEIKLPLTEAEKGLRIVATHPEGYVQQSLTLKILELDETAVEFKLLQSVKHPDRRLEMPPVLPGKIKVLDKRGKAFDLYLRKQKPPVLSCDFQGTDLSFLEPLLSDQHQLIVRFLNNSKTFGKRAYMKSIDVWLEDVDTGREAKPRLIDNIGTRLFPDGVRRPLVEHFEEGEGHYEVLSLDQCEEPAGRWELVKQALEHTVKDMLKELE